MDEQLQPGKVNENRRDVRGTKTLLDCSCTEQLWKALIKDRLPRSVTLGRCRAKVRASGTVVWPIDQTHKREADLRASSLEILSISAEDDDEIRCYSGTPQFYKDKLERYNVGQKYSGNVDPNIHVRCTEGFHFWHHSD